MMNTPPPKYYRKLGGGVGMHKSGQSWVPVVFLITFVFSWIIWNVLLESIFETQNPVFLSFITACVVSTIFSVVVVPYYKRKAEKSERIAASKISSHESKVAERAISNKSRKPREYK